MSPFQEREVVAKERYVWIIYIRNKTYGNINNRSPLNPVPKRKWFLPTQTFEGNDLGDREGVVVGSSLAVMTSRDKMKEDMVGEERQPIQEVEE